MNNNSSLANLPKKIKKEEDYQDSFNNSKKERQELKNEIMRDLNPNPESKNELPKPIEFTKPKFVQRDEFDDWADHWNKERSEKDDQPIKKGNENDRLNPGKENDPKINQRPKDPINPVSSKPNLRGGDGKPNLRPIEGAEVKNPSTPLINVPESKPNPIKQKDEEFDFGDEGIAHEDEDDIFKNVKKSQKDPFKAPDSKTGPLNPVKPIQANPTKPGPINLQKPGPVIPTKPEPMEPFGSEMKSIPAIPEKPKMTDAPKPKVVEEKKKPDPVKPKKKDSNDSIDF